MLVAQHNLPVIVREGNEVKTVSAGFSVLRIGSDGTLTLRANTTSTSATSSCSGWAWCRYKRAASELRRQFLNVHGGIRCRYLRAPECLLLGSDIAPASQNIRL